jgi:signal transduction histidine kinase
LISIYDEYNDETEKNEKYLKIKVIDTGIGIEEKD